MIKILTAILLILNPVVGFLNYSAEKKENPLAEDIINNVINLEESLPQLPLSADIFLASGKLPFFWPDRNFNIPEPAIEAKTALIYDTYYQSFLFQKNDISEPRPIASLTKLMTSLVVLDKVSPEKIFQVSRQAVETYGEMGKLNVGESISVKNLLAALLIESSNDAAIALAENIDPNFVSLMNEKAQKLGLKNSHFADPSGLDPKNVSSAQDMIKIMEEVLKYPLLQEIMQSPVWEFYSTDGAFFHRLINTNKLLGQIPEIVAGKTGYTEEAGNCMIIAAKSPNRQGFIISIIMASPDRLGESKTLIEWTKKAFLW